MRLVRTAAALAVLMTSSPASAHPAPFSYLDIRVQPTTIDVTVVVHAFDVAQELKIDPERVLEPATLLAHRDALTRLLGERLVLDVDGRRAAAAGWTAPEPIGDRDSVRLRARYDPGRRPGLVAVTAALFPYDPQHQTFVNFYERDALASQAILGRGHPRAEYFTGTRQGTLAVVRKFLPAGFHHILIGPDHLLFLFGLLLLGGPLRRLALVVSAFTLAHSVTLSLAALNIFMPPAHIVEPAIALSIVYVGADNLLIRDGRDLRAWIAFGFGLIHGFGFANVLSEMNLPGSALAWSLVSFNVGIEIGQLLVVVVVAGVLAALRARSEATGRRVAVAGSLLVIAAGAFWFVQRVFFSGGLT